MAVTAAIKFTQGVTTAPAGEALVGVITTPVTCTNGSDAGPVVNWQWTVVGVPEASALTKGTKLDGTIASYTFVPDVAGGYCLELVTRDGAGNQATDLRVFLVPEASGRYVPPFGAPGSALNFSGQTSGWAPYLDAYLRHVDSHVLDVLEEGVSVGTRSKLNFIGAAVTAVDNPGASRIDVTITGTGSRTSVSIAGSGTTTLTALQSASSVIELTGILTGDAIVELTVTDGRVNTVVNNTTGTGFVQLRAVSGSTKLFITRGMSLPVYCGSAELFNAGRPSRIYTGAGTQPYYWWRCDEADGVTTLVNRGSTFGVNNLTLQAGAGQYKTSLLRGPGENTLALFPGVANRYATSTAGQNPGTNSFMWGGWFKYFSDGVVFAYGSDHTISVGAGAVSVAIKRGAGTITVTSGAAIAKGCWAYLLGGIDNSTGGVKVWVDGYLDSQSAAVSAVTWSGAMAFTAGQAAGGGGLIEDYRVYNVIDYALPSAVWARGMLSP